MDINELIKILKHNKKYFISQSKANGRFGMWDTYYKEAKSLV